MGLEKLSAGKNPPEEVNVVIEISSNSSPIKYEMDKESGLIKVDRFLGTAMFYPCEYGFIPQTLSEDGDPVDVLVISPYPLHPKVVIACRPVGMLRMEDESGRDTKILAVPTDKLSPLYKHIQRPEDLPPSLLLTIEHFFKHYKDLETGKWARADGWADATEAKKEINASIERYQEKMD